MTGSLDRLSSVSRPRLNEVQQKLPNLHTRGSRVSGDFLCNKISSFVPVSGAVFKVGIDVLEQIMHRVRIPGGVGLHYPLDVCEAFVPPGWSISVLEPVEPSINHWGIDNGAFNHQCRVLGHYDVRMVLHGGKLMHVLIRHVNIVLQLLH